MNGLRGKRQPTPLKSAALVIQKDRHFWPKSSSSARVLSKRQSRVLEIDFFPSNPKCNSANENFDGTEFFPGPKTLSS